MPGIGDTLREARMRQKIDIADVESATKIRAKYLRALENEEFDLIQGSTFVRSFLRTYASHLGLDAQRLIEEYRAHHESRDELELHTHIAPRPQRGRDRRRGGGGPRPGTLVALAVVALLAFLLVLGLTGGEDEEPARRGGAAETAERRDGERAERRRRRSRRRAAAPRAVRVRIAPAEPTYVCVDRGPGTRVLFEGTLGGPRTFRGRRVRVNVGRTSAELRVDGRRVDLGGGSEPVGFDFTRRARRPLPIARRPCV